MGIDYSIHEETEHIIRKEETVYQPNVLQLDIYNI